jgi:hypothetical protein
LFSLVNLPPALHFVASAGQKIIVFVVVFCDLTYAFSSRLLAQRLQAAGERGQEEGCNPSARFMKFLCII